ncbi:MAG: alpha-N-arabinofuranosidase [Prevotella sp.]|nr:alpha-N-arabinofuranosidase [Prevotella sp.]
MGQLLSSDYGPWGQEKRMVSPFITRASDGTWRAVWQVNNTAPAFAVAFSNDLITWRPQDYPVMSARGCLQPVVIQEKDDTYIVYKDSKGQLRQSTATTDFRHFSIDSPCNTQQLQQRYLQLCSQRDTVMVNGKQQIGQILSVSEEELSALRNHHEALKADARISEERMHKDKEMLLPYLPSTLKAVLSVENDKEKMISDKLIGIFFEDISYAADGGLYAELIQNRDFEYSSKDYNRKGKTWNATTAWEGDLQISTDHPLSTMNPHHLLLKDGRVRNNGWDGICLKKGEQYDFSLFVRNIDCKNKKLRVTLVSGDDKILSSSIIRSKSNAWTRYSATFIATADCDDATLQIEGLKKGVVAIDMVSLFPHHTYKGHGMRKDLAETIAALHPKFVRFPGGCMSHGQGISNIYRWSETIGPWQDRKPDMNIWNYHQTRGLGFYEYFQWCEDMGAEPLPVLAAGVPCQNSQADRRGIGGQQGGIPLSEMPSYIDEILHLIEWANGDASTNEWAKKRAEAGHPEPFHLKYIGIGNEDLVSTTFEERYEMISRAIHERYPDIIICGTAGPFHTPSSDYLEGWRFNNAHPDLAQMVDEHYYESTGWFLNHQDYYDRYDRSKAKVYLGEWSSNSDKRRSDVECALTEAIYLCNIERNGDIVEMTSYAPLLCNDKHHNWDPDLIYFDNKSITLTPSYETQRLFGTYAGNRYIHMNCTIVSEVKDDYKRKVSQRMAASLVKDSKSGRRYLKIVNALPIPSEITVEGLSLPEVYEYEELTGKPSDTHVLTQKGKGNGKMSIPMPPYSFKVITL